MYLKDMIKVRFNLSRGRNYMKWKVEYPNGDKVYLNPDECTLIMHNTLLKNNRKVSEKIYNGHHKMVCAWVLCEHIEIVNQVNQKSTIVDNHIVRYNPRVTPNWVYQSNNVDNFKFGKLITYNRLICNYY